MSSLLRRHPLYRRPEQDLALANGLLEAFGRLLFLVCLLRLQMQDVLLHELEGTGPLLQLVAQGVGQFRPLELRRYTRGVTGCHKRRCQACLSYQGKPFIYMIFI